MYDLHIHVGSELESIKETHPSISWVSKCLLSKAMYVHEACSLARAAVADGLQHGSLTQLARLGARGAQPQNEQRDFHRLHDRTWGAGLEPQLVALTLKNENRSGNHRVDVPLIAPYEMFHHLYEHGNFRRNMLGDGSVNLREYWSLAMSQPWAANHPLQGKPEVWPWAIPIVWFTDGAEFTKGSQTEGVVYQWSSAIVEGITSMESKYLTAFLVGDTCLPITNDELVAYFAWCSKVWLAGRFPDTDFYGSPWPEGSWRCAMKNKPIAGPYFGVFSAVTHDAKARYETHHFANYYNCNYICESCLACVHPGRLSYCNFRKDAPWRNYRISHERYLQITPASIVSPWSQIPGWHLSRCLLDWMHCNHLGVGRDVTAQIAFDLCTWGYIGPGTLDEQLQRLWLQYRRWARKHKVPYSRRRFNSKVMGLNTEYAFPEMNSRTKAAHIKPLVHFLAMKARNAVGQKPADEHASLRAWTIWGLADTMFVFDTAGPHQ
jgi:hypothetical protein